MIRYFTAHPTAANLLMIGFFVLGILGLPNLKRETFPEFAARAVQVTAAYPGASAEDVEDGICRVLEDALDGVSNVDELRCEAREGIGTAVADMAEGADVQVFLDDIRAEVDAIDSFPDLVERPIVQELNRTDRVVSIAVSGPMAPSDLKRYAEDLKTRLLATDEIPQVLVTGFSDHQLRIEFRGDVLRQYGLSVAQIADTIRKQSLDQPVGILSGNDRELLLRVSEERRSPREFQDLVVLSGPTGAALRLGDIATITDTFEDEEVQVTFNGQRAARLDVNKNRNQDVLTVYDAVARAVEEESRTEPPTVEFHLTQNVASIVRDRLRMLVHNGWQGLILVALTLWLFFGTRYAFWVAMGLPVSFFAAFFCMQFLGQSINMISMVALLVALGLLMDDAIVLAENIATHRARGTAPLQAAIDGARQVAPGVVASYLTTVAVFGPLAFLSGEMGSVLRVLPITLILTLTVSLIEAFLILPAHLYHSLSRATHRENAFRRRFDAGLERVRERVVGRITDLTIAWRYLTLGVIVALFLFTIGLVRGGILKFQGFPSIDGDQIVARILLPQGTPLAKTQAVVAELERSLAQVNEEFKPRQPRNADVVENVLVQYSVNADANESGPHVATVAVDLLNAEVRHARNTDLLNRWRELSRIPPDVIHVSFTEPTLGPGGRAIQIRLQAEELADMKGASLALQAWLADYRGLTDLSDDLRPGKPELRMRLREGALNLGLDADTIARQLRAAYFGTTASEIQVGAESYEIDVRLRHADRERNTDLERFPIRAPSGVDVPLSALVTIEETRGFARIQHVDGQRTVTIVGNLDTDRNNAAEIVRDTRERFLPTLHKQYPRVRVLVEGEAKSNRETGTSMLRAMLIGLTGIFIILSFQFGSYREPLLVMAIIPMAVIGVFWGHVVMGLTLSMPSMMGMVSLAGVAVNDSILLVEFIKEHRRQGMPPREAAAQASRARFRAVLLTSATTVAGLLPILSERSLQAQVLIPLVASIAWGLATTTLLVLFLIPVLYSIFNDFGWTAEVQPSEEVPA